VSAGTVLIASPEHLSALRELAKPGDEVQAFSDAEALRALDVITRQRPGVIALDRVFAATSRGAALINRIKADPSLTSCEIRIVAHERGAAVPAAPPAPAEGPRQSAPLDQRGTRRAPRFRMTDNVEITIDGNPARLIDLSVLGAMVVSLVILKPNQRVRVSMPLAGRPIRHGAMIAWAAFELPKGSHTPQYRAGLEFYEADSTAVQTFIDTNKR
jgi:hypothetical protein